MVIPKSQSLRTKKPLYEPGQALAKLSRWIVTEQFSCFGNVCTGQRHIAGLLRQPVNFCLFPKHIFNRHDQVFELNRIALTKIEDIEERAFVLESSHGSVNHVINVSVITARGAVSELIDRLPGVNAPRELMNGQIGPLARTVHGEVTKRHDTQVVEIRVGRAKKFASDFRGGIRTKCL